MQNPPASADPRRESVLLPVSRLPASPGLLQHPLERFEVPAQIAGHPAVEPIEFMALLASRIRQVVAVATPEVAPVGRQVQPANLGRARPMIHRQRAEVPPTSTTNERTG